jgi:hypothetical protein
MKVARFYLRVSIGEQDISRLSLAEAEQRVGSIRAALIITPAKTKRGRG